MSNGWGEWVFGIWAPSFVRSPRHCGIGNQFAGRKPISDISNRAAERQFGIQPSDFFGGATTKSKPTATAKTACAQSSTDPPNTGARIVRPTTAYAVNCLVGRFSSIDWDKMLLDCHNLLGSGNELGFYLDSGERFAPDSVQS